MSAKPKANTRVAALEAIVDNLKQSGDLGNSRRWPQLREEEKFDRVMAAIRDLALENEPAAYNVLFREVDVARPIDIPGPAPARDARDGLPTPQELQAIHAEWRHDAGLRHLENRAVRYEDQADRAQDHTADAARRAQFQQPDDAKGLDR
jgi:hypothetical protein